ncbi:MAG: hypothetical protein A3F68_02830 [Acidobacteria bacterium RIFCSPLOWO2_12_FULL_54_10]|nr:MAG: hypothetical protein A3F68_02830 [Acidobacteria bacterium RIFCSPLOWO2_12_FULL_54_10]
MKNCRTLLSLLGVVALFASAALAQNGNGAPKGAHYNLNIIGVEKAKTADMTGSNRHTIFVALNNRDGVASRIYLIPAADFRVCDGNGFDAAFDCDGNQIQNTGAVFELPCNTNLSDTWDHDGDPATPEVPLDGVVPCEEEDFPTAYEVWARALGKIGGTATMTTCATEVGDVDGDGIADEEICSLENVVLLRTPGKQIFKNVTDELTSLVVCIDQDPTAAVDCDYVRYALFTDDFEDWVWQYYNTGLRLAQLRFYLL